MSTKRPALGHTTMAEAAADELRKRILTGEFVEGFQLKQDALASEFGISRIPIREALVLLESEGLVRIVPHRGAIVSELSPEEIGELFSLRAMLEPYLLRRSVPKLTKADFSELDRIVSEYGEELHGRQPGRWGELNTELHMLLLSRADKPRTHTIVTGLLQQTDRYTRLQLSLKPSNTERASEEHSEIVRLCRKGDARAAASLLKRHIEHAGAQLEEFIRSQRS